MSNRYADDIKRIVGIDLNQSQLAAAEKKSPIPAKRGIGYMGSGGTASGVSGTPGQTQLPSDLGKGDTSTGYNAAGETGLNPYDVQAGVGGEDSGAATAAQVIDGEVISSKISSPIVTADGLKLVNNGAISKITAVDCDTGKNIEIRLRGDYVPPAGWTDAETPPSGYDWVAGTNYYFLDPTTGSGIGAVNGETAYECAANGNRIFGAGALLDESFQSISSGSYNGYGDFYATYDEATLNPVIVATYGNVFPISSNACSVGVDSYCPVSYVPEILWPSDNTYILKLVEGQFVTSTFDEDVPAKYKNPSSKIDFCFGAGGARHGSMEVTKDGGNMIYETSGGNPTGIIRVYDSSGSLAAAFDYASGWMAAYRP